MRRFLKPDPWSETPWSSQNHAAEEFLVRSRSLGCSCEISIRQASLSHQSEDRVDCRGDELVLAGLQRHTIAVRSTSTATLGIHGPVNPSMKLNLLLGRFTWKKRVVCFGRVVHHESCLLRAARLDLVKPHYLS